MGYLKNQYPVPTIQQSIFESFEPLKSNLIDLFMANVKLKKNILE